VFSIGARAHLHSRVPRYLRRGGELAWVADSRRLSMGGPHMVSTRPRLSYLAALAVTAVLYAAFLQPQALGAFISLNGEPVDYGYESPKVCCIDVAAVNLLNYLARQPGNSKLIPDANSIGDQQEDFHKKYDPGFQKLEGDRNDLKKGLDETFKERNFTADVKLFLTRDLTYETLLKEWNDDELIILLAREVDRGWGHALFLWGLESDKTKPRLSVTDPNIHPNTNHKLNGTNTNSKGTATASDLAISTDATNAPDWRITLHQLAHTYTDGDLSETFDAATYRFRITAFASVSDVKAIAEPATLALFGIGFASLLLIRRGSRSDFDSG
jgi:hypothetical protein